MILHEAHKPLMMKNLTIILLFWAVSSINAQTYSTYGTEHEIKFNIGRFLINTSIEASYEYYFTEDTSIGGTVYFNSDATKPSGNFGIGPTLRAYFGYAPKSGFFAEAFSLYYTSENEILDNNLSHRNNDYDTTAIGLGLGRKWSTFSQKLTFEAYAGLGRNISPQEFQNTIMFRSGLSIGIRF